MSKNRKPTHAGCELVDFQRAVAKEADMYRRRRFGCGRKGIALPTALAAMVVIGIMIAGVFFMSTQEVRAATGSIAQERAFRAAELGLNQTIGEWDNFTMSQLPPGTVVTNSYLGPNWATTVHVTKVGPQLYNATSRATVNAGPLGTARRSTGLALRTLNLEFNFMSALTVRGDAKIGGSSFITGNDWNPPSWDNCADPGPALAGVAAAPTMQLQLSGCQNMTCVEGHPKLLMTAAAADTSNYFNWGDMQWADLTAMATRVYEGAPTMNTMGPRLTEDGKCDYAFSTNWGEPWHTNPAHKCETFFPVIHFKGPGSVNLSGGRGQGILLVDGDLEVSGGFTFYGPVIVRGTLKTLGQGGSQLNGAVMAANIDLQQNTVLGDATVRYSACAIEKAKQAAAAPMRLKQRAWVEGY